jgi:peptide/nickel transport system substrate-binding protein
MKITIDRVKGARRNIASTLTSNLDLKKKADRAHRNLHKKSQMHTRRHVSGRIESIKNINTKRLVFSWSAKFILILILGFVSFSKLNSAGRFNGFVAGGDAVVGIQDETARVNLNPLTISSPAESATSKLIHSSIIKYDSKGEIRGDLAETYSTEDDGKKFKFKIKENVKWHDGKDLTSDDVVFTISKLKDSRVGSSLRESLVGVEAVAIDAKNVELNSPKAVAGINDLLTKVKIAPKHLFENVADEDIARADYNSFPIGSGPLVVSGKPSSRDKQTLGISGEGAFQQLSLTPNESYYGNKASTDITFRIFEQKTELGEAFNNGSVEMVVGTGENLELDNDAEEIKLKISSGIFSFFNTESPNVADARVRRALAGYVDRKSLSEINGAAQPLYSPVIGIGDTEQAVMPIEEARKLITEAGWAFDATRKTFTKEGADLKLSVVTGESEEYERTSKKIAEMWNELGVQTELIQAGNSQLQSNYFVNRSFDVLIYGISLNQASDPFAYWSSDSANPRGLNFSNYKSPASDADLDIARTKINESERNVRLERFVKRWKEDAPAAALYIPSVKVIYKSGSLQPEPNQTAFINGFGDSFEFLTELKAEKKKIYQTVE